MNLEHAKRVLEYQNEILTSRSSDGNADMILPPSETGYYVVAGTDAFGTTCIVARVVRKLEPEERK